MLVEGALGATLEPNECKISLRVVSGFRLWRSALAFEQRRHIRGRQRNSGRLDTSRVEESGDDCGHTNGVGGFGANPGTFIVSGELDDFDFWRLYHCEDFVAVPICVVTFDLSKVTSSLSVSLKPMTTPL